MWGAPMALGCVSGSVAVVVEPLRGGLVAYA